MGEVISDGRKSNGGQFIQPLGKWKRGGELDEFAGPLMISADMDGSGKKL